MLSGTNIVTRFNRIVFWFSNQSTLRIIFHAISCMPHNPHKKFYPRKNLSFTIFFQKSIFPHLSQNLQYKKNLLNSMWRESELWKSFTWYKNLVKTKSLISTIYVDTKKDSHFISNCPFSILHVNAFIYPFPICLTFFIFHNLSST